MSARACYRFWPLDDWPGVVTVYQHQDGDPAGAAKAIEAALAFAWPLPRYECEEFAAAFVAANKWSGQRFAAHYLSQAAEAEAKGDARGADRLRGIAAKYGPGGAYRDMVGGGVRLVPFEGADAHRRFVTDTEYLYDIRCIGGRLRVTAYTTVARDDKWWIRKFFEGDIEQLSKTESPAHAERAIGGPDFYDS
jgi:hypothetical protein